MTDPDKPRTCYRADGQRKLIYLSRREAKAAARRNERLTGTALRVYGCDCGYYHTTARDPH